MMEVMSARHDHRAAGTDDAAPVATATAVDPVCGMTVTPHQAAGGHAEHAGRTFWFCSPRCRERFAADP
ncbi:MAG TPA: YHS domain-containing protein, partial [Candidatus Tectomicrobia bacterium]|nr:YHS domain-containing protein [Candidatus Tectomicrobia bacterium]